MGCKTLQGSSVQRQSPLRHAVGTVTDLPALAHPCFSPGETRSLPAELESKDFTRNFWADTTQPEADSFFAAPVSSRPARSVQKLSQCLEHKGLS